MQDIENFWKAEEIHFSRGFMLAHVPPFFLQAPSPFQVTEKTLKTKTLKMIYEEDLPLIENSSFSEKIAIHLTYKKPSLSPVPEEGDFIAKLSPQEIHFLIQEPSRNVNKERYPYVFLLPDDQKNLMSFSTTGHSLLIRYSKTQMHIPEKIAIPAPFPFSLSQEANILRNQEHTILQTPTLSIIFKTHKEEPPDFYPLINDIQPQAKVNPQKLLKALKTVYAVESFHVVQIALQETNISITSESASLTIPCHTYSQPIPPQTYYTENIIRCLNFFKKEDEIDIFIRNHLYLISPNQLAVIACIIL